MRKERGRRRREKRRRRPEGDERVHVGGETPRGTRPAHEDVASREAEDERRQAEEEGVAPRESHLGHREDRDRHRDRRRHGKPPREVRQCRCTIGLFGVDELFKSEEVRVLSRLRLVARAGYRVDEPLHGQ